MEHIIEYDLIDDDQYKEEIIDIMNILQIYNNNISNFIKKKKDSGNIMEKIRIKLGNKPNSKEQIYRNCKVKKIEYIDSEDKTKKLFVTALCIYNNNDELLLKKELKIVKTINTKQAILNLDNEIQNNSIIIKMKNLLDKINNLNNLPINDTEIYEQKHTILTKEEIDKLQSNYQKEYSILKDQYNNYITLRNNLYKANQFLFSQYNSNVKKIDEEEKYLDYKLNKNYTKLLDNHKTFTEFSEKLSESEVKIKEKRYLQEYFDSYLELSKINDILEKSESNISMNNIFLKKKNLMDYYDNNIYISDDKEMKVVIKYKNQFDDKKILKDSSIKYEKKKIEFVNDDSENYPKIVEIEYLFNNKNREYLIISDQAKPDNPGYYSDEYIMKSSIESNKYEELKMYPDWRIKLDYTYINYTINSNGIFIVPIIIDKNHFASVYHYYYYMLFNDNKDIDGKLVAQYQKFANSLLLNLQGTNSKKSINEIYEIISSCELKTDREDFNYNNIINKALFAQYYQNDTLLDILKKTEDSVLIRPSNYIKKYIIEFNLMIIRYLLKNEIYLKLGNIDYSNYVKDKADLEILKKSNNLYKKYSEINLDNSNFIESNHTHSFSKILEVDNKPSINHPKKVILESLGITNLDDSEDLKLIYDKIDNEDLETKVIRIEKYIKKNPTLKIIHQPYQGDCLFFSIIEAMYENNIEPYDFNDKNNDSIFNNVEYVSVNPMHKEDLQPRHTKAVLNLREILMKKLEDNLSIMSDEILKTIFSIIKIDYGTIEEYISFMKKPKIAWGGEIEIILASALFNIDIKVHSVFKDSEPSIQTFTSQYSKKLFPNGLEKNLDFSKIPEIILGYLSPSHYVVLIESKNLSGGFIKNNEILWEKRTYWITDITHNDKIYKIASLITKNHINNTTNIDPEGIYDIKNEKLIFDIDKELWNEISNITQNYYKNNVNNNPKNNLNIVIKNFYINAINNDVFNPNKGNKIVGKLVIDKGDEIINSKIKFF